MCQDKNLVLRYLLLMTAELEVQVVDFVVRKHLLDEITTLTNEIASGDAARRQHVIRNLENGDDEEVKTAKKVHKGIKRSDFTDWMMQNGLF